MISKESLDGFAAEHLVVADLIRKGYTAFLADPGCSYDIIVETLDGIKRVQVKSSSKAICYEHAMGVYRFELRNSSKNNRTSKNVSEIDVYAFVSLDKMLIAYMDSLTLSNKNNKIPNIIEIRDLYSNHYGKLRANGEPRKRWGKFFQHYSEFKFKPPTHSNSISLQTGKIAEHIVVADLLLKGFPAFLSSQSMHYDAVVEIDKKLNRVQIKSKSMVNKIYQFTFVCGKGSKKVYDFEQIELFAFVANETYKILYINSDSIPKYCKNISVKDNFRTKRRGDKTIRLSFSDSEL